MLLTLLALPLLFGALLVARLLKRDWTTAALGGVAFAATASAAIWAILQSRSSTAGIGFLFVPVPASLSALLAMGFALSRRETTGVARWLGLGALLAACVIPILLLRDGRRTIEKNTARDADQHVRDEALARYRETVRALAERAGDRAADSVIALVRSRPRDRELVLAALEQPVMPAAMLDSFARSDDLGIALQAVRNPATMPATLERVYRTHSYRDYFLQALAAHEHTPPETLREISQLRPAPISGLDIWFAGNPSTPPDVLLAVARRSESIDVVHTLLGHPALTCPMADELARARPARSDPRAAEIAGEIAEARSRLCR